MSFDLLKKCLTLGLGIAGYGFRAKAVSEQNEFGDKYEWQESVDASLKKSEISKKPIMVVIHNTKCEWCTALKSSFAKSEELLSLSANFQMVKIHEEQVPPELLSCPDGPYVPRILFISSEGRVMKQFYNEIGNTGYKYFYSNAQEVVRAMQKVIDTTTGKPEC